MRVDVYSRFHLVLGTAYYPSWPMSDLIKTIQRSLLELVGEAVQILPSVFLSIIVVFATWYGARLIKRLMRITTGHLVKSISLQLLFEQIASVAVWVLGILLACTLVFPGLALGDIIGLLGLSSVAVGFAFQDIFKNFLAGILLLLNEPFRVRDQIIVNDYEGTVESITIRSTQILTYQGERIVIPNAIVFTSPVHVLTHYPHRRTDLKIGLDYATSLPEAHRILLNTLRQVDGVLAEPPPEVDVVGFGDSAIDVMVRYWTAPQKKEVRRVQTQVVMWLKQACDDAKLTIPFPIRTVYFADQNGVNGEQVASQITSQQL